MRPRLFVRRSLSHNGAHHAPAVIGAALAGAVLLASLYVGDSVRGGLEALTRARHAGVGVRVVAQSGPIRLDLARDVAADLGRPALAVWHLVGTLGSRDGAVAIQGVHLYGVEDSFWAAWGERPPPKGVHRLNGALTAELERQGASLSDLVFRGRPRSALATDTPLAATDTLISPVPIWGSAYEGLPSRIGPPQQAQEPQSVFVPLAWLQDRLQLGPTATEIWVPATGADSDKVVHRTELSLLKHFKAEDVGLTFTERAGGVAVRSESLLLPRSVADRAASLPHSRAHLTWFVDTVSSDHTSAPFTFVASVDGPTEEQVQALRDGEGLINQWLARDLKVGVGDELTLRYHRVEDAASGIAKGETSMTIAGILPMRGLGADRTLTPDFPGITTAKRCQDWEPGVAMDKSRIRERDEEYWQRHGASPKVILPLATGRALWGSRFGDLNEVLLREPDAVAASDSVLSATAPASLGLQVQNRSDAATGAERPATDFGVLFLSFSAVLILASLLLTGMLFSLSIERRDREIITLRRIGLPESQIRALFQREALALSLAATMGAIAVAPLLASAALGALRALWPDSIGGLALPMERTWLSTLMGAVASTALVYGVQARSLRQVLRAEGEPQSRAAGAGMVRGAVFVLGGVAGGGAAWVSTDGAVAPDAAFFSLGAAFLAGSLMGVRGVLRAMPGGRPWVSFAALAFRGMQRNPSRSLAVIASLALAAFLVVGVGAHGPSLHGQDRVEGATGGFALMVETSIGLDADVRTSHGRGRLGLLEEDVRGVDLWPLRVRGGDDASCLSPGRAQRPRVLGIDSARLSKRGAFTSLSHSDPRALWARLGTVTTTGAIPVVGDEATLRWGLGLGVGARWQDVSDSGDPVVYEVVGMLDRSFLQGSVITSEGHVARLYPHSSQTRMILAELDGAQPHQVARTLRSAWADLGARVTTTPARLQDFSRVETSYMRIFLAIGLLGVLLGAAGASVLLARNALERKREFATLRAMGHSRLSVWWYLTAEHFALVLAGLCLGSVAAFVGLWPTLSERSHEAPIIALAALGGIVAFSLVLTSGVAWRCLDHEPAQVLTSNP